METLPVTVLQSLGAGGIPQAMSAASTPAFESSSDECFEAVTCWGETILQKLVAFFLWERKVPGLWFHLQDQGQSSGGEN